MKIITLFITLLMTLSAFAHKPVMQSPPSQRDSPAIAICTAEITIGRDISMLGIELIQGNDKEKSRLRKAIADKATLLGVKLDPKPSTMKCLNDWTPAQPRWNKQITEKMLANDLDKNDFLTKIVNEGTEKLIYPPTGTVDGKASPLAINLRLYSIGWNCGLLYQSNYIAFIYNDIGKCSAETQQANTRGAKAVLELIEGNGKFLAFFRNDSSFKSIAKTFTEVRTNKESVAAAKLIAVWPEKFMRSCRLFRKFV